MTDNKTLLIWDLERGDMPAHDTVVLWQSYKENLEKDEISIPLLVENNADYIKSQFLSLIFELGNLKVKDKEVIDILEISSGFSLWWMTLLIEKCNYSKSQQIDTIIKLMMFNKWRGDKKYSNTVLVTENRGLISSMEILINNLSIVFISEKTKHKFFKKDFLKKIYHRLPNPLKAIIFLAHYLMERWSLKGIYVDRWKKSTATTSFISYFFNIDLVYAGKQKYKSNYWSILPDVLEKNNIKTNWLHIYVKSEYFPTVETAKKLIKNFNKNYKGKQNHVLLDSFLSLRVIKQVVFSWLDISVKYLIIRKVMQKKLGYLWPLIKYDLSTSLTGEVAIQNLLFYYLYENSLKLLPKQKNGIYIQENQGWEFGFINLWKKLDHGELIGMPHSTIRYWDLRYFFDPRLYKRNNYHNLPLPDKIGVNGEEAKKIYIDGGYPVMDLFEVEALRYLQYEKFLNHKEKNNKSRSNNFYRILVLGDYLKKNTDLQLQLLQEANFLIDYEIQYVVKPHPMLQIFSEDYPDLNMIVTDRPIYELIDRFMFAYTSSVTSAALDAYCAGLHVVTVLDPKILNNSPLRNKKEVSFVSTSKELANVINSINDIKYTQKQGNDYFYIDSNLPKWKKLLNIKKNIGNQFSLVTA